MGRLSNPLGSRSGREPTAARSPLRLRLVLSIGGAAVFAVLGALLLSYDRGWPPVVAFALAATGVLDAVVIRSRLRRERSSRPPARRPRDTPAPPVTNRP